MKHLFVFIIFYFSLNISSYSQNKISRAEKSLKKEKVFSEQQSPKKKNNNSSSNKNSYVIMELIAKVTLKTLFQYSIEKKYYGYEASFTKHPYFNDSSKGNFIYKDTINKASTKLKTSFSSSFIIENKNLYGSHLNFDISFLKRVGIEVDYLQLWESYPNTKSNSLAIINTLAKYYRVRTEKFSGWWGLGSTYILGEVDSFGFLYAVGFEIFFKKPFSLENRFYGSIVNSNPSNRYTASFNYYKNKIKLTSGYEFLKIGSEHFSTFKIGLGVNF